MSGKRNKLEIINDVLEAVRDDEGDIKPTHVMYQANLSHAMLEKYLGELLEKDFLEEEEDEDGKTYSLKEKGYRYLEEFEKIKDFADSFGLG